MSTKNTVILRFGRAVYYRSLFITLAAVLLCGPVTARAQIVDIDRVVSELEPEIQRTLLAGNIPSASIALIAGDKVIWTNAYGYSNLWARTPATPDTVYLIGSTFKAMSTVALLQQMEQGKFKLDDPVTTISPISKSRARTRSIRSRSDIY